MSTSPTREIWFVTGSQGLYGEETLRQVATQSQVIAEALDAVPDLVTRVVWKPVLTDAAAIRRLCLDATADDACIGLIAWMHTFSPAKMWIGGGQGLARGDAPFPAGEDVEGRFGGAPKAAAAPAHAGQHGPAVGGHRHGL